MFFDGAGWSRTVKLVATSCVNGLEKSHNKATVAKGFTKASCVASATVQLLTEEKWVGKRD
jgi:hypothetical protein